MKQQMRERAERFVVFPFAIGCTSEASVAVSVAVGSSSSQQSKKPKPPDSRPLTESTGRERRKSGSTGDDDDDHPDQSPRPGSLLPNLFYGLQKLVAETFKTVSHIFVYRDEMEDDEIEMDIGFPTDVKHVTHIGFDGSTMANSMTSWDNLSTQMPHEILTFPVLSPRQFELGMAT
ncbi:hypothetical protein SAY86_016366 [Trapa natans]|uniref:CRIB domain-containing protein n=1 Tax=Trapa natans TaxID=22666 RepID=A0AAN7LDI2_TRANT|nr:hypothetical protein SAY86_016366 [Trapa natans]